MVKAYLRYAPTDSFGVIASSTARAVPLPNTQNAPLLASAAVDAVAIWNLRTGALARLLSNAATRKAGPVTALAAAGALLAAGYADGTVRLWQSGPTAAEPRPVFVLQGHRAGVSALAFSPDGASLASGANDGDVILWNATDGSGAFRVAAHRDAVTGVLLVSRGDALVIVSASKDALVKVFDVATQHCLQTVVGHHAEIWAIAWCPARRMLLTGTVDAEIRAFLMVDGEREIAAADVWKAERVLRSIGSVERTVAADRVASIAFEEVEGVYFAVVAGVDKSVDIFRVRSGKDAEKRRKKRVKKAAAEEEDGDGEKKDEKKDEKKKGDTGDEAPDEQNPELRDYLVSLRNLRLKTKPHSVTTLPPGMRVAKDSSAGPELQLLVQLRNNAVEVHGAALKGMAAPGRKGKRPRGGSVVKVEEVRKHLALEKAGHRKPPRCVALSRDGNTLLATGDGHANIWNVATRACVRSMDYSRNGVSAVLLGAEARLAVVGSKTGELTVFDVKSGSAVFEAPDAHGSEIWSMCLDGEPFEADTLITGSADKRVRFWDLTETYSGDGRLRLVKTMEHANEVLCVRVAHGRARPVLLVSLTDNTVRAYMLDTLEPYLSFYGHRLPVLSMDVSSDGQLLATGSADKSLKVWGLDFGDCRRSLRAHGESVLSVTFQPKTHYVFTGSRDGELKYWDTDKFELIASLDGQRGEVRAVATSSDGEVLASASDDRLIRVWRRTDEPVFLEEVRDERLDAMLESGLTADDDRAARGDRVHGPSVVGDAAPEAERVGRRTLDAVKGGEALLEGLRLAAEEAEREPSERVLQPNPLLLGLSPERYLLRCLERVQSGCLPDALGLLPLDAAVALLRVLADLLAVPDLCAELIAKAALLLLRLHHSQVVGGALARQEVALLGRRLADRLAGLRKGFGTVLGGLEFWAAELAERDDGAFTRAKAEAPAAMG